MMFYLLQALYYGIPLAALIFFVVSLVRFRLAKRANLRTPNTFTLRQMAVRRVCLIVSACIAVPLVLVIVAFSALLMLAVAFM